jgi:MarR family transcriptional regulator, lower aerobic nicotinate degradation pathway regulator
VLVNLQAQPAFLLRRAQQILTYFHVEECERSGTDISQIQFEALCVVQAFPGVDQTTLARRLGIDRASATVVIGGVIRHRLVSRSVQADRRRRALKLTRLGEQKLKGAFKAAKRSEARFLQPLGRVDRRRLIGVLLQAASQRQSPAPEWEPARGLPAHQALETLYRMSAFLMDRCSQVGNAYLLQVVAPFGLSAGQYGVLAVVALFAPIDQSGLCRTLGIDRSSVSVILPVLEARGLITRKADLLDRRRSILRCTPAGLKLLQSVVPLTEGLGRQIFAGLGAEFEQRLCALLARLVGAHDGFHTEYSRERD